MKRYKAAAAKAAGFHYARKVLEREQLVRADRPNKDELRVARAKKAEAEEKEESDQEEKLSVEPEGEEESDAEDQEEESGFEDDPPGDGGAKEKKEKEEKPGRAKNEEREENPREAREAIAITGSTSTAMQRMLAQGLAETNRVNLTVVEKKLKKKKAATS